MISILLQLPQAITKPGHPGHCISLMLTHPADQVPTRERPATVQILGFPPTLRHYSLHVPCNPLFPMNLKCRYGAQPQWLSG